MSVGYIYSIIICVYCHVNPSRFLLCFIYRLKKQELYNQKNILCVKDRKSKDPSIPEDKKTRMTSAREADIFSQGLEYEPVRKDRIGNACFAALASALATVNFGYALGYTAEAELLQNLFQAESQSKNPTACSGYHVFAV